MKQSQYSSGEHNRIQSLSIVSFTMSRYNPKLLKRERKHKKMTHFLEKKDNKTKLNMVQMLELAHKDFKAATMLMDIRRYAFKT